MLPHRAILSNLRGAYELLRPLRLRDEVYLSFLPLSHSYEHTVGQFFFLSLGVEVVYSRGVEHLASDMLAVRPTILTVVPRILEVIRGRILLHVGRQKPWRRTVFRRALDAGFNLRRLDGQGVAVALDETVTREELDRLCAVLGAEAADAWKRLEPYLGEAVGSVSGIGGQKLVFYAGGLGVKDTKGEIYALAGEIADAWLQQGLDLGPLGMPTSKQYNPTADTVRVDFEGGSIDYNPLTGAVNINTK